MLQISPTLNFFFFFGLVLHTLHHSRRRRPKGKGKEKGSTTKKPIKTKDNDAPKRPLSSYNYFFQQEREKLVKKAELNDKAGRQGGRKTAGTGLRSLR